MPATAAAALAHDARNAITGTLGRIQLLRRQAERGDADPARLLAALADAETRLRRLAALIDALEDAAESPARPVRRASTRSAALETDPQPVPVELLDRRGALPAARVL